MALTIDEVTRVARQIARDTSPVLEVAGVTLGGGGRSRYVEILINIRGCRRSPCRIELGVFRDMGHDALQDEIARKLREHLANHPPVS